MGTVLQQFREDVGISKNWATARFLTFMVLTPVGVSFSILMCYTEHVLRLRVEWKSTYLPSWTYLVLISLCPVLSYAILLKLVPCPLLSSFNIKSPKVGSLYGKGVWANLVWTKNVACHSSKQ